MCHNLSASHQHFKSSLVAVTGSGMGEGTLAALHTYSHRVRYLWQRAAVTQNAKLIELN